MVFPALLAIGSALATGAGLATLATYLMGASIVAGIYTAREQRRKAQRDLESKVKDRLVMVREATADRPYIFGRVRVSGQVQFPGSSGQYAELMHFVLSVSDRADAIEEVWFGDESIGTRDADGWVVSGSKFYGGKDKIGSFTRDVPSTRKILFPHDVIVTVVEHISVSAFPVAAPGYIDGATYHGGDPDTDEFAYSSIAYSYGTEFTFHPLAIGKQISINYIYLEGISKARAKAFLGAPGQTADPYLIAQLPGIWKTSDMFTGVAGVSGTFRYDQDLYPTGIPQVSVVGRFELCYDPRTGTRIWTRNPVLIAARYLEITMGVHPATGWYTPRFIAAANACDEAVNVDAINTQVRYTFDDVIPSDTTPHDGLERIVQSMVGSAVESGGLWYIWAGVWEEPTIELDESDLSDDGEITIQSNAEADQLFNGVSGKYVDPVRWVEDEFPSYISPTYMEIDGDTIPQVLDIDLTQITDVYRAQRVAKLLLFKARQALTFSCTCSLSAYDVTPGDMVKWTLPRYGWTNKEFRCMDRVYHPDGGFLEFVFQEDAEDIYAWDYNEATNPDPSENTNLPDPRVVSEPVLTFASGSQFVLLLADGTQRPFLRVYWEQLDILVEEVEILWKRTFDTNWSSDKVPAGRGSYDIFDIAVGEKWIVGARAWNGIQVRSNWVAYVVEVDPTTPSNSGSMVLGIGSNIQPNATMANTASGWIAYMADGATIDIVDAPAAHVVSGVTYYAGRVFAEGTTFGTWVRVHPYNAILLYATGGPTGWYGWLQNDYSRFRLPVKAGDRVEVQTRAASSNANALLYIQIFDYGGNYLGELSAGSSLVSSENKPGNLTIDSFKHLWGIIDIPEGVASVSWALECRRSVSGATASYVAACMPYLGYARAGQVEPTEWSVGPSGGLIEGIDLIGTGLIEEEATTEVFLSTHAGATMSAGAGWQIVTPCSVTYTNDTDGDVVITASTQGWVRVYFGSQDNPSYCAAVLIAGSMKNPIFGQSIRTAECTSGNAQGTFSLVDSGVIASGASITISLQLTAYNRTNLGPVTSSQFDYANCTLRVEAIKR